MAYLNYGLTERKFTMLRLIFRRTELSKTISFFCNLHHFETKNAQTFQSLIPYETFIIHPCRNTNKRL
jgi:hypothetical protein